MCALAIAVHDLQYVVSSEISPHITARPQRSGLSTIRASVDALCRDGTGQISRDPRKNGLKTRR